MTPPATSTGAIPPGLFTLATLGETVARERRPDIIQGLIPRKSVTILVAPPGTGKTPFCFAAALCVSGGVPFLGMRTTAGQVLYADGESAQTQFHQLGEALRAHHGLDATHQGPLIWSPNWEDEYTQADRFAKIESLINALNPSLVVTDTMRSLEPSAEGKNDTASLFMKRARKLAHQFDLGMMLVHHLRKPARDPKLRVSLESDTHLWFNEVSGAGAIISQADVRLGLAPPEDKNSRADLVLAGFSRGIGKVGPFYLAREYDDSDAVRGYVRLTGAELLPPAVRDVFEQLGGTFRRRDLSRAIGGNSESNVTRYLDQFRQAGLIAVAGRGEYQKVGAGPK